NDGSVDGSKPGRPSPIARRNGDQRPNTGKGDPLEEWKPYLDLPHADGLEQCRDTARKHGCVDELHQLGDAHSDRRGYDDRDNYRADGEECQYVLEPVNREITITECFIVRQR